MIPPEHYYYVYLIIVTIATLIHVMSYAHSSTVSMKRNSNLFAFFFTILMIMFIGFRPISGYFGDMPGYANGMLDHRFEGLPVTWDNNYLFYPMMALLSSLGASPRTPILLLAIINFGCTLWAMRRLFPNDVFLAMLVFFGAFSTFGAATNGLKAGCAVALFLVAISYRERPMISILFLFLSMGFHHSMQLPIVAYIICSFYKNTNVFIAIWFICLIVAAAHITSYMGIIANYTDDHGAEYLLIQSDSIYTEYAGKTGFRYDFVLYSAIPVIIGYVILIKDRIVSDEYRFMYNFYLLVNAVWMLCMYAQFTNRIASLSWFLYPVLIIYPRLHLKRNGIKNTALIYIVLGHLAFTLFMQIFYYV